MLIWLGCFLKLRSTSLTPRPPCNCQQCLDSLHSWGKLGCSWMTFKGTPSINHDLTTLQNFIAPFSSHTLASHQQSNSELAHLESECLILIVDYIEMMHTFLLEDAFQNEIPTSLLHDWPLCGSLSVTELHMLNVRWVMTSMCCFTSSVCCERVYSVNI